MPEPIGTTLARDYNRGLAGPVRWVHGLYAGASTIFGPWVDWTLDRRHWAIPAIIALAAFLFGALLFEGAIDLWLGTLLRADVNTWPAREIAAFGLWGGLLSIALTCMVIWRLDPAGRRRLADLAVGAALVFGVATAMQLVIGRPAPTAGIALPDGSILKYPGTVLWPWGAWPVEGVGVLYAWQFWRGAGEAGLWSMPSASVALAAALSVFLMLVYPRLRAPAIIVGLLAGLAPLISGENYPSDVIVGACVGYAVMHAAVTRRWGGRLLGTGPSTRTRPA